jgi:hypothetical protein
METIGVINIDPWFLSTDEQLKTDLLYFDKLIYNFDDRDKSTLIRLVKALKIEKRFEEKLREIDSLEKTGLIILDKNLIDSGDTAKYLDVKLIDYYQKTFGLIDNFKSLKNVSSQEKMVNFFETFREVGQINSRMNSIILNSKLENNYIPIIKDNFHNSIDEPYKSSTVLSIVYKKFPQIPKTTPLEKIIELKSDENNKLALMRLRNWVLEMSTSNYNSKEIEQKLDYLLAEYRKNLELHQLKYNVSQIETYTNVAFEVIENIVKFNFSKASKTLFDLTRKNISLMEDEQKIHGKELAFIHNINDKNRL